MDMLIARDLAVSATISGAHVPVIQGLNFSVPAGKILGLVGESGCGKTTIGRLVLRLVEPTAGTVTIDGTELFGLEPSRLREFRRRAQIVIQDPFGSLNPRMTIGGIRPRMSTRLLAKS